MAGFCRRRYESERHAMERGRPRQQHCPNQAMRSSVVRYAANLDLRGFRHCCGRGRPRSPLVMLAKQVISEAAPAGKSLTGEQVAEVIARACPEEAYRARRVLVIVPDGTRTAPVGLL